MRNFLKNKSFSVFLSILFICLGSGNGFCGKMSDYEQITGIIHMDSDVSGGENTPEMLASVARSAGAKMAIITDHDNHTVSYGFWPLRNVLKISYSLDSIEKYGAERYIRRIKKIDESYNDLTFIPGIEAVPYYYWEKSRFTKKLLLNNLHRHILVFGLDNPKQIEKLPSLETGFAGKTTFFSLLGILWFIPLIISIILYKPSKRKLNRQRWEGTLEFPRSNLASLIIFSVSILFIINDYPFKTKTITQYENAREKPYQELIDYVNKEGGLTFWAHPEAVYEQKLSDPKRSVPSGSLMKFFLGGDFSLSTLSYEHILNDTKNYTGFAIFSEGDKVIGKPEGFWDSLLLQFCKGTRTHPVWAISELDIEKGTDPAIAVNLQNVLLVKDHTEKECLEALRTGRVIPFKSGFSKTTIINDYSITSGGKTAISGEVIGYNKDAVLNFDIETYKEYKNLKIVIVRDGKILSEIPAGKSTKISLPLEMPVTYEMSYVRVTVFEGNEMRIATNPIFFIR